MFDPDLLEDGLVELSADRRGGGEVELVAVADESEGVFEAFFGGDEVVAGGVEFGLGLGDLSGDSGLFGFQHVDRHRVGVVEIEKLLAFALQDAEPELGLFQCSGLGLAFVAEEVEDGAADGGDLLFGELDGLPDVLDLSFDPFDQYVALVADELGLPTEAVEVGVDRAVPVAGPGDAHPGAAV